jgi:Ribbon-helix-helix protein, copG family
LGLKSKGRRNCLVDEPLDPHAFVLRRITIGDIMALWMDRDGHFARHKVGETPITVEQAEKALNDANRIVFDPDPAQKPGGRVVRTVGYSRSAGAVLCVITVTASTASRTARPHSRQTTHTNGCIERRAAMTKRECGSIDQILDEAAEDDLDVEIPGHVTVTRGGPRTRVLQVRLNDDELAALEALADARGLPASTVVREMILSAVDPAPAQAAAKRRLMGEFKHYLDTVGVSADIAYSKLGAEALVGEPPARRSSRRTTTRRRGK